jgi:hypothetical protein
MNILTKEERNEIISCSVYWNEVKNRENQGGILFDELQSMYRKLGVKLLWILEAYAKKEEK